MGPIVHQLLHVVLNGDTVDKIPSTATTKNPQMIVIPRKTVQRISHGAVMKDSAQLDQQNVEMVNAYPMLIVDQESVALFGDIVELTLTSVLLLLRSQQQQHLTVMSVILWLIALRTSHGVAIKTSVLQIQRTAEMV